MSRSEAREITALTKKEIDTLFKKAKSIVKKQGLDIRLAPKAFISAKLLLVIPRKAGNAPKRNRLKRRLKSIFYEEQLFNKEFDWIIVARKEAIDRSFHELHKLLLDTYTLAKTT